MTTTHKALQDRMAAQSRWTSTGDLSTPEPTLQDAELRARMTKASALSRQTNSGVYLDTVLVNSQEVEASLKEMQAGL